MSVAAPFRPTGVSSAGRSAVVAAMAFFTVVDLFATQAILPMLAAAYGVAPSAMGMAVNACTLGMAVAGLATALFSRRIDRRNGVVASLVLLAVPTALLALAPDLTTFTLLRVAQGLCMSTAFTLTLAWLGERRRHGAGERLRRLYHRQCREQPRRQAGGCYRHRRLRAGRQFHTLRRPQSGGCGAGVDRDARSAAAGIRAVGPLGPPRPPAFHTAAAVRVRGSASASCSPSSASSPTSTSCWSGRRWIWA